MRSILEGQSSTNSWLELPRRMSTTTMQFARRRHAEFARTRGLFLSLMVQLCCNVLRVANWNTKRSNLVLRRPTWDLLSTPHQDGSLELLPSKRLQLASNLRRSRSSSCPGAPVCLSAPTSASAVQILLPDPGRRTDDVNVVQKSKQSFTSRSEACTATIARCCLRLNNRGIKGLPVHHLLLVTRAEHPRPRLPKCTLRGCRRKSLTKGTNFSPSTMSMRPRNIALLEIESYQKSSKFKLYHNFSITK